MAPIKLYYSLASPVSRSTLITVAALGLDVEKIELRLSAGEHMKPEFLKKNPLHTVPTLEDGDFVIFESSAINAYLVGKYGKNDSLYPKDLQKRAVVDQRLHFNNGYIYGRIGAILAPLFTGQSKTIDPKNADSLKEAYGFLETLIGEHKFVAGDQETIADFSLVATVSSAACLVPIDKKAYPKVLAWLARIEALPYVKINKEGVAAFSGLIKHLTS